MEQETPASAHNDREQQRRVYDRLIDGFQASEGQGIEQRWQWLMAAHIVGQMDLRLHIRSHVAMLGFAARTRDWPEAAGQVFRLALVPPGHALGRLPAGNIGRATVNAFRPMPLGAQIRELIGEARRAVARG
jgi:hypothetical protein